MTFTNGKNADASAAKGREAAAAVIKKAPASETFDWDVAIARFKKLMDEVW